MGRRKGMEELIALSGDDGKELWSLKVGLDAADEPSSTPTVDGDRVYAVGTHGDLVCANVTGKELWRKSFVKDFGGSVPTWKYCESPLIDGDKLICTPGSRDATMVALNKKTGDVIWKAEVPNGGGNGSGYSSIVISQGAAACVNTRIAASRSGDGLHRRRCQGWKAVVEVRTGRQRHGQHSDTDRRRRLRFLFIRLRNRFRTCFN